VETFLIGRLFGYGAITLHSYNGNLRFKRLPAPDLILGLLEFERLRVAEEIKVSDEQRMRNLLERRFGDDYNPEVAKWKSKSGMPAMTMYATGSVLDALARFFGLRQVKKGAVIYRTHWWILLRKTFLPALLLVLDVIFVLVKMTGGVSWMSASTAYIFAILLTVGAFGWWLYRYIDWHNDTYTITSDQLLDINRKPLAMSEFRSAPLRNIQTVEYMRKGLIGLILNFGTVRVQIGNEELTFDNVYDPGAIQTEIFAHFKGYNDAQKRKEQEKLADFLQIYDVIKGKNDTDDKRD